jgi:hypothetical protein
MPVRKIWYLLLVVQLFTVACSKKVITTLPPPPKSIDIQSIDFEYLHGKTKITFRDNTKEQEVKAHIRIRKDSVIWMTFHVLGVQGGKALINKDSITVVSSLKKEYYVYDYAELSKRFNFNINYDVVQAAVLGNPIMAKRAEDEITTDSLFNQLLQRQGTVSVKSHINKTSKKLESVELHESNTGNLLKINYSDFQPLDDKLFPYKGLIDMIYKSPSGLINNSIVFEYTKVEVGTKELRFPFNIPKKYDRR